MWFRRVCVCVEIGGTPERIGGERGWECSAELGSAAAASSLCGVRMCLLKSPTDACLSLHFVCVEATRAPGAGTHARTHAPARSHISASPGDDAKNMWLLKPSGV